MVSFLSLICPLTYHAHSFHCYPHFGLYCLDQSCSPCHQTSTCIHFVNLCLLVLPGWYMSLSLNRLYNSTLLFYTSLCTSSTFVFLSSSSRILGNISQRGRYEKKRVANILTVIGNGIQEIQEAGMEKERRMQGECNVARTKRNEHEKRGCLNRK